MCKKDRMIVKNQSLAKKTNLGPDDAYVSFLLKYKDDKDIRNIGVFGTYGSGKSSVVSSFIKETNRNAIYFSQDTFNKYIDDNSINIRDSIYKELLSYTTDSARRKQYLRTLFIRPIDRFIYLVLFALFIASSIFLGFFLNQYLGWLSILVGISAFSSELIITYLFSLGKIKEANVEIGKLMSFTVNANVSIDDEIKNHPVIIENMLIKILEVKKIKYIVIEDIERLKAGKIIDYIKEFKILNDLINRSKEYSKDPIVFFYGLKDFCVDDSELRTKYFDLIVPIIPYTSFSNAEDSILSDESINKEVSRQAVYDISTYFKNQRQVIALITQYNLNKVKTFSNGLKDELFALSALNVLFPRIYGLLLLKGNFLDEVLKIDYTPDSLSISIRNSIKRQLDSIKIIEKLEDKDINSVISEDAVLFIKTCILKKYFTYNYEKLLCSNVKSPSVSSDVEILKKINGFESINGLEVKEPGELINKMHNNVSLLFSEKKYLNIDIAKYVISSNDSSLNNQLKSLIMKLSLDELIAFVNDFTEDDNEESAEKLIRLLKDHHLIYEASARTKKSHKIVYWCFKNANSSVINNHSHDLKKFFEVINSNIFIDSYGKIVPFEKYKELVATGRVCLHTIEPFSDKPSFIKLFEDNNAYEVNGKNLAIIFPEYIHKPVYYFINNSYVNRTILQSSSDKMFVLTLLANTDKADSKDNGPEIHSFLNSLSETQFDMYSNNPYFSQWFFKVSHSLFNGSKNNIRMMEHGFFNLTDNGSISSHMPAYKNNIENCLKNNSASIDSGFKFNEKDSWFILFNFDDQIAKGIQHSLTLTNVLANCPSMDTKKKALCAGDLLPFDERKAIIQFLVDNDVNIFFELLNNGNINIDELKTIKLSQPIAVKACSDNNVKLLNLFALSHNVDASIAAITANQTMDFCNIFYGDDVKYVGCESIDLFIEYFCSESRNFDRVASIIDGLDDSFFADKSKWARFLESFKEPESTQWDFYYYSNNPNNKKILDKMFSNGVITNPILLKTKNQYKCKILN